MAFQNQNTCGRKTEVHCPSPKFTVSSIGTGSSFEPRMIILTGQHLECLQLLGGTPLEMEWFDIQAQELPRLQRLGNAMQSIQGLTRDEYAFSQSETVPIEIKAAPSPWIPSELDVEENIYVQLQPTSRKIGSIIVRKIEKGKPFIVIDE